MLSAPISAVTGLINGHGPVYSARSRPSYLSSFFSCADNNRWHRWVTESVSQEKLLLLLLLLLRLEKVLAKSIRRYRNRYFTVLYTAFLFIFMWFIYLCAARYYSTIELALVLEDEMKMIYLNQAARPIKHIKQQTHNNKHTARVLGLTLHRNTLTYFYFFKHCINNKHCCCDWLPCLVSAFSTVDHRYVTIRQLTLIISIR